jgi:oligopeptidase B
MLKISPGNELLLFTADTTGNDTYSAYIRPINSRSNEVEVIENVVGGEWGDDHTLFYTVADELKRPWRVYRHTLGTDPSTDTLVYEESDDAFFVHIDKTKDKKYVVIMANAKSSSEVRVIPVDRLHEPPLLIHKREPGLEYYIDHYPGGFYIVSNAGAEVKDLVLMRVEEEKISHGKKEWKPAFVPPVGTRIEDVDVFEDYLISYERAGAVPQLRVLSTTDFSYHFVPLPETICALHPGANANFNSKKFRFGYSSPLTPECVYDYDITTKRLILLKQPVIHGEPKFNRSEYECKRVEVKSGQVQVPLTLIHRKDIRCNSNNPVLLVGYGAYGQTLEPEFREQYLPLLMRGWIIALAHVRGGGELGKEWYLDGNKQNKLNSFKDYIACAEFLVQDKYTQPQLLVAKGASAGGLLVGGACAMRPDLFGAALISVGFLNPLGSMLDPSLPLTIHEYEEWGNPTLDPHAFRLIASYDPYLNLNEATAKAFPFTLLHTSTLDSRVPVWHAAKFAARMRYLRRVGPNRQLQEHRHKEEPEGEDPNVKVLLLQVSTDTGHAGEGGRYNHLKELAFDYAFLFKFLKRDRHSIQ